MPATSLLNSTTDENLNMTNHSILPVARTFTARLLFLLLLLVAVRHAHAIDPVRMGFVDMGRIMDETGIAKNSEAEARQAISKERNRLQNEIELLESKIEKFENRKTELEKLLADPTTYKQGMLAINSQMEFKEVQKELGECYEKWEAEQGELENLLMEINK